VFFKTFLGALVIYLLFLAGWNQFENTNLIPGLIMVGSFAVPIATLIFFVEINARRNVSLYQVIRLLFLGGILSIIFSLILFELTANLKLGWLGASVAGMVEEPGKLLALFIVVNIPKYKYKLNGLLFGAAIGTGFAAFESAGYALRQGLISTDMMKDTIMVRGMLSPFGHIAWTAMCGAALWRVKGESKFAFEMVKDERFLKVFGFAVVLHMLWNTSWNFPFYSKFVILGVAAWVLIFALIQDGLKELRDEKAKAIAGGNEDIITNAPAISAPGDESPSGQP
jgi:RsiW-degrading membrane proteinase PrsW (M82 family)